MEEAGDMRRSVSCPATCGDGGLPELETEMVRQVTTSCSGTDLGVDPDLNLWVSVADPMSDDNVLLAVSPGFETMTGYSAAEAVGKNCRFLNEGCILHPRERAALRIAARTGAKFTGVLTNRRKCGEHFLNMLDIRGLTIGRDHEGIRRWILVGIHMDVTNKKDANLESLEEQFASVARVIRKRLVRDFAYVGLVACNRRIQAIHGECQSMIEKTCPTWIANGALKLDWRHSSIHKLCKDEIIGPTWAVSSLDELPPIDICSDGHATNTTTDSTCDPIGTDSNNNMTSDEEDCGQGAAITEEALPLLQHLPQWIPFLGVAVMVSMAAALHRRVIRV